ncbi:MAG: hypothetical protein ACK5QS_15210 [Pseudanabaenaceae cyanobacterium]
MDQNVLDELRQIVNEVAYAATKKDVQKPLKVLEFRASVLKGTIEPYLSVKLSETITYAKEASGNVKNKEHWISCVRENWHIFESGIKQDETKKS